MSLFDLLSPAQRLALTTGQGTTTPSLDPTANDGTNASGNTGVVPPAWFGAPTTQVGAPAAAAPAPYSAQSFPAAPPPMSFAGAPQPPPRPAGIGAPPQAPQAPQAPPQAPTGNPVSNLIGSTAQGGANGIHDFMGRIMSPGSFNGQKTGPLIDPNSIVGRLAGLLGGGGSANSLVAPNSLVGNFLGAFGGGGGSSDAPSLPTMSQGGTGPDLPPPNFGGYDPSGNGNFTQ